MIHLLHGADAFRSAARLRELRAALDPSGFNGVSLDGQSPDVTLDSLRAACDALAFFGGGRCVDVKGLLTRWGARSKGGDDGRKAGARGSGGEGREADPFEALAAYLPTLPPTTTLLLWEPGPFAPPPALQRALHDRGAAIERFDAPIGRGLRDWVADRAGDAGVAIRPDAVDALLDAVCPQGWREAPRGRDAAPPDLGRLDSEIRKLATAIIDRDPPIITARVVAALTVGEVEINVFRLIDAIAIGDARRALAQLRDALAEGVAPEALLALLAAKFSAMVRVRAAGGARAGAGAASILGLSPYRVQETARQLGQLGEARAGECLRLVLEADEALKTGRAPRGEDALYWVVLELCRVGAPVPLVPAADA